MGVCFRQPTTAVTSQHATQAGILFHTLFMLSLFSITLRHIFFDTFSAHAVRLFNGTLFIYDSWHYETFLEFLTISTLTSALAHNIEPLQQHAAPTPVNRQLQTLRRGNTLSQPALNNPTRYSTLRSRSRRRGHLSTDEEGVIRMNWMFLSFTFISLEHFDSCFFIHLRTGCFHVTSTTMRLPDAVRLF